MSFSSIRQTPPWSAVSYATATWDNGAQRGAFLHEALFRIWHEIKSSDGLAGLSDAAEIDLVEAAVRRHAARGARVRNARVFCENVRAGLLASGAAAVRRDPESLAYPRTKQNLVVSGRRNGEKPNAASGGSIADARPDRIDELEDGRRSVIDYKTRAPSKTNWLGDRPQEPQLPLYSLLDSTISGIAFAELPTNNLPKFVALGEDLGFAAGDGKSMEQQTKGAAATWTELVAQWQVSLEQLAVEFMAGVAAVAPRPGACDYVIWRRCVVSTSAN